jgi:hypothetical protein
MSQMAHSISQMTEIQRNMVAQHQRTLNCIVGLESRVAWLERQIRASEEDE